MAHVICIYMLGTVNSKSFVGTFCSEFSGIRINSKFRHRHVICHLRLDGDCGGDGSLCVRVIEGSSRREISVHSPRYWGAAPLL